MDDRAWAEFRARLRTRTGRQMAMIICPFVIVTAVLKILEPMDYPVGDVRTSIEFRLVFYGAFILVAVVAIIASARWLLADRRVKPRLWMLPGVRPDEARSSVRDPRSGTRVRAPGSGASIRRLRLAAMQLVRPPGVRRG
jgi:hypothetical protein